MRTLILDCSAAVALVLPDESSAAVEQALAGGQSSDVRLLVPSLWWYESTSVLMQAARRGRVSLAQAREALSLLSRLPDETRDAASLVDAVHLFHLAERCSITAYDAAYVALAEVSGGTLLSLDTRLCAAAAELGIETVNPSG